MTCATYFHKICVIPLSQPMMLHTHMREIQKEGHQLQQSFLQAAVQHCISHWQVYGPLGKILAAWAEQAPHALTRFLYLSSSHSTDAFEA